MKRLLILLSLCISASCQTMQPWLTRAGDNARSGWNSHEITLTQASVTAKGLSRKVTIPVVGDARGMEAQPLIVPNVPTVLAHQDMMILPSMANVVRAVDAHSGAAIWQLTLGMPVNGSAKIDMHQINQHWGCLSTGVVDPDTLRLYQVCEVSMDGSGTPRSGQYEMFVIDLTSGTLVFAPVPLQGTDTSMWKQRSSLVMTNVKGAKTIFFAHGSVYETSTGYTGGITAFDVATNTVAVNLPMTAGIWMAGSGLSADADGYLYATTGNGDFNPSFSFYGESFIKVQYMPKSQSEVGTCTQKVGDYDSYGDAVCTKGVMHLIQPASLAVLDQWSPWTDYARAGKPLPVGKLSGESLPSEESKPVGGKMSMDMKDAKLVATMDDQGQPQVLVYPMASGGWSDEDWGSSGPACIFAISVCIASGKDGIGYPISTKALGSTSAGTVGTAANYAKLAAPCFWATMSPGPLPCAPTDSRQLNFFPGGDTAHVHMTPVQIYDPLLKSWVIFIWGENQQLHKWAIGPTGKATYIAQSNEFASASTRSRSPGGMPGGFCAGSSNGNDPNSMLLVCSIPYGDANAQITNARILVYDPVHLAADGSLKVLWDSQQWGWNITFNKFMPPVIDGGEVILPNYSGGVEVFQ